MWMKPQFFVSSASAAAIAPAADGLRKWIKPAIEKGETAFPRSRLQHAEQGLIFRIAGTCPARSHLARSRTSSVDQALILGLVDQGALLDPRHHVAELDADFLDRVGGELGAGRLERGLVDLVFQHPVAREFAGLDVG